LAHSNLKSLIRQEAIDAHAHRLSGEVFVVHPVGIRILAPILALLIGALIAFASLAHYPRTETVSGYLSSSAGTSTLVVPRAGVVQQVHVRTGDEVQAGDVLLVVASDGTLRDGGSLEKSLRQQLLDQRFELEQRIANEQRLLELSQERRREKLAALSRQIERLVQTRALAGERARLATRRSAATAHLQQKGAASERDLQEEQDVLLRLRSELESAESNLEEQRDESRRLQGEVVSAPLESAARSSALRLQISELDGRLAETSERSSYAVKAPISGSVAVLQVEVGSTVNTIQPVAVLMPFGGQLQANLLVPTRAAGFIEQGQVVGIKYEAFPFQQFGIQRGEIRRIDRSILGPTEVRAPIAVTEPVYRVIAVPKQQAVKAFGRLQPLQVGMLLQADIVLERRSLLQWLLEPLYTVRGVE
jgi:membrane fusion protein